MDRTEARQQIVTYLQEHIPVETAIDDNATLEEDFGWVFFYNSAKYMATQELRDTLVGNAPLIVDRETGTVQVTGTARPLESYIEEYRRSR